MQNRLIANRVNVSNVKKKKKMLLLYYLSSKYRGEVDPMSFSKVQMHPRKRERGGKVM